MPFIPPSSFLPQCPWGHKQHKPLLDHCFSACWWGRAEHLPLFDPGQALAAEPGLSSVHGRSFPVSGTGSVALPKDGSSQQPRDQLEHSLGMPWIPATEIGFDWPLYFRQRL